MSDVTFYLVLGIAMTIVFVAGLAIGALVGSYLKPTLPVLSDDDVKFLTTNYTLTDEQRAANNRAYKERFKNVAS